MNSLKTVISNILNHKFFLVFVVLTCLYTQGRQSDKYFGWTNEKNILPEHMLNIHTDGAGYYSYLPQWFIYPDKPYFSFIESISKKHNTGSFASGIGYDYVKHQGVVKYYIGTAVCISPFFLTNHWINKGDGYSRDYQLSVSLAALFYWLIGIIGLIKLLQRFEISNSAIALLILIVSLGTNLNFYTVYFPSFSHVYSFCWISWFLYFGVSWTKTKKNKFLFLLAFALGLVFIIRPTNVIIALMIPFLFQNFRDFISTLKTSITNNKLIWISSVAIFILLVFLQILTIHSQTGKWSLNTYTTEHFEFLTNPKIPEVLFGYRKGFFVYAPIMLLLLPAIFFLRKKGSYFFLGWSSVFLVFVYLTSSWWCWWYGGGLGMRTFIDFLPLLVIPIAVMFQYLRLSVKWMILPVTFAGIYFYQILQIQYNRNILHYDIMTKESFWRIFLKTDKRFSWMLHFKEDHISSSLIIHQKTLYFDYSPIKGKRINVSQSKEIVLKQDMIDPSILFVPDSSWINSNVGIRISGEMKISNPESNPAFEIRLFKDGKSTTMSPQFIGFDIDHVDQIQKFSRDFDYKKSYSTFDFITIRLLKGAPPTTVKDLKVDFFALKRE